MHSDINQLFDALWQDYVQLTPSAAKIHALLASNKPIINDHIALRTFNLAGINLSVLAKHFEALGYQACGDYQFTAKKLNAKHYQHPDPTQPKVFISELLVDELTSTAQQTIHSLIKQCDGTQVTADNFLYSGRHWQLDSHSYQELRDESEYAAWVAAFGYHANHFTVSINQLAAFSDLAAVNQQLKQAGFKLNQAGGEIKGSPQELLEQSATLADPVKVQFTDTCLTIPGCFYEFALRYPMANGELYSGFVAASADKIFESTDTK